jgi:hypothetical protein
MFAAKVKLRRRTHAQQAAGGWILFSIIILEIFYNIKTYFKFTGLFAPIPDSRLQQGDAAFQHMAR